MKSFLFNTNFSNSEFSEKDILSTFKENPDKSLSIHRGMTIDEISNIVSEKIILVVKDQFETTKIQFENKEKHVIS
jgi:hypothetical protein